MQTSVKIMTGSLMDLPVSQRTPLLLLWPNNWLVSRVHYSKSPGLFAFMSFGKLQFFLFYFFCLFLACFSDRAKFCLLFLIVGPCTVAITCKTQPTHCVIKCWDFRNFFWSALGLTLLVWSDQERERKKKGSCLKFMAQIIWRFLDTVDL